MTRRSRAAGLAALTALTLTLVVPSPAFAAGSDPVTFTDSNLKDCVANWLSQPNTDPITEDQMATLTSISCDTKGITSLVGLEFATNLESLNLPGNPFSDLTPIAGITTITSLNLSSSGVTTLSPISGYTNLTTLIVLDTDFSNIAEIAGFTALTYLNIGQTDVADLTDIESLTILTYLLAAETGIVSIEPISTLTRLTYVDISSTGVTALDSLTDLTALATLRVNNTTVSDLSPLGGGDSLVVLSAQYTDVEDISALASHPGLKRLYLEGSPVSSLVGLEDASLLEQAYLSGTAITSIAPLAGKTKLLYLSLDDTGVTDLSPLADAAALVNLDLASTPVTSLVPIAGLRKVTDLYLSSTPLTSLHGIEGWTSLVSVNINNSDVEDLNALAGTPNLKYLYAVSAELTDISGIRKLRDLEYAYLGYNHIVDAWDARGALASGYLAIGDQTLALPANTTCTPVTGPGFRDAAGDVFSPSEGGGAVPLFPVGNFMRTYSVASNAIYASGVAGQYLYTTQVLTGPDGPCNIDAYAKVFVDGALGVGRTVTARPVNTPISGSYSYLWYRGATPIAGATGPSYTLVTADKGKKIKVTITVTHGDIVTTTATSPSYVVKRKLGATDPTTTGAPKVGASLHAKHGSWTSGTTFKWQWYRDGVAISGATKSTYKVKAADAGRELTVRVTGTKSGYAKEVRYSSAVDIVVNFYTAPTPVVAGSHAVGNTLTANHDGWQPNQGAITFTYQWLKDGKVIAGATDVTYTTTASNKKHKISVRVTASRSLFATTVRTSAGVKITA